MDKNLLLTDDPFAKAQPDTAALQAEPMISVCESDRRVAAAVAEEQVRLSRQANEAITAINRQYSSDTQDSDPGLDF